MINGRSHNAMRAILRSFPHLIFGMTLSHTPGYIVPRVERLHCIAIIVWNYNVVGSTPTDGDDMFVCTPQVQNIPTTQLCDGNNNCDNGDDETSSLCESEIIFTYIKNLL